MVPHRLIALVALSLTACGARTDLGGETEEVDGSVSEDASPDVLDSTVQDSTPDVQPDVPVEDASPDVETDAGPLCVPNCSFDFQCQQTCPAIQTGLWCCDDQVGTCYAFSGQQCPTSIFDAGFD